MIVWFEVTWRVSAPWPSLVTPGTRSTGCPSSPGDLELNMWPANVCLWRVSIKATLIRNSWRIAGEFWENLEIRFTRFTRLEQIYWEWIVRDGLWDNVNGKCILRWLEQIPEPRKIQHRSCGSDWGVGTLKFSVAKPFPSIAALRQSRCDMTILLNSAPGGFHITILPFGQHGKPTLLWKITIFWLGKHTLFLWPWSTASC